jgi:endonuclease/exonuclease/phosphatase family metal-dependent hydrolase
MPVNVIGTLKPKNNGKFPVAEAVDIKVTDDLRLDEALENKADLSTVNFALDNKADKTTTTSLQNQINNIISPVTEDAEVINAREGADGTSYQTLKARLDAESVKFEKSIFSLCKSEAPTRRATFSRTTGAEEDGSSTTRICTDNIPVKAGDVILVGHTALNHAVGIWKGEISLENNIRNDSTFIATPETINIEYDGYICIAFAKSDTTETLTPDEFDTYVKVVTESATESELIPIRTQIGSLKIAVEGNRIDKSEYTRMNAYISGGKEITGSQYPFSFYVAVTNNIEYTIKKPLGTSAFRIAFTDSKPVLNMQLASYIDATGEKEITVTATGAYMFVTISFSEELSILEDIYAAIQIYTGRSGSLEERVEKLENVPFDKIRVASYNTGNFTGEGLDEGSTECKLAYRKAIGEVGADLFGLQEDTQYFYDDEDTYPSIYSMYKYYQREGQYEKNFKAFLSNYQINNVKQVFYENRTNMSHYYFLVGELVIKDKKILVVSVHYDWNDITRRRSQISQVISYANNYERAIIIGDNNPYDYTDGVQNSSDSLHAEELAIWEAAGYTPANAGYFGEFTTDLDAHNKYGKVYPCDNIIVSASTIKINNANIVQKDWMDDHAILWADVVIY